MCHWPAEYRPAPLAPDDVHLWLAALNGSPREINHCAALLSVDERARAERFLQPVDRGRFVAARGFLRTLLSYYTETAPFAVRFQYNPYGKPALCDGANPHQIQFNLSHSGDVALLAVTRNRPVGVDLERITTDFDCRPLFRRFLSPSEQVYFDKLPPGEMPAAWFRFWTIKEACTKAVGTGLTVPLGAITPPIANIALWKIRSFVPCSGYSATVVVTEGEIANLVCRRWTGSR